MTTRPDEPLLDGALIEDLVRLIAEADAQSASLRPSTRRAFERLRARAERLREEARIRSGPIALVGTSRVFRALLQEARALGRSGGSALFHGESGSGRLRIARMMHEEGSDRDAPWVLFDARSIASDACDAALVGGAGDGGASGAMQRAEGGTLVIQSVDALPASSQARLTRWLRTGTVTPVGERARATVSLRLLLVTDLTPALLVERDLLRADLVDALEGGVLRVPPLRERPEDVIPLCDHFVSVYNRRHLRQVRRIATSALDMLNAYHWPGNVRELEGVVERAVLLSTDDVIHGHNLPPSLQTAEHSGTAFDGSLQAHLDAVERELILDALKSTRGNMAAAARRLDVTERVMGLRVRRLGIDARRFRGPGSE